MAYSNQVKSQVLAALLAGQAVQLLSEQHKIPERTIQHWRHEHFADFCAEKKEVIGLQLLQYLEKNLNCLMTQFEVASDENYLRKQSASDLAILHGTIADKGIRVINALHRIEDR